MMQENKHGLLMSTEKEDASLVRKRRVLQLRDFLTSVLLLAFGLYVVHFSYETVSLSLSKHKHKHGHKHGKHHGKHDFQAACPQVDPLYPGNSSVAFDKIREYVTGDYANFSISYLSKSVTFPTISYDDLGKVPVDEDDKDGDERWKTRFPFIEFLETSFPLLHSTLKLEKVNTFGLFYTWQGSDASLKPSLLMAHTDVVPVPDETVSQWTHPPFAGHFDGEYVWGRGSSDCKNQLIAIFEAITILLEQGFTPSRTVLLSFGFDEEISGGQGAGSLAPFVLERYGKDGVEIIIDEGNGFIDQWGTTFASPGVSEKGHINVEITVRMPGGHSSVPSDHTAIGVSAELITLIEAPENKYTPEMTPANPYLGHLRCGAAYAPEFPSKWARLLAKSKKVGQLALEVAKEGLALKYLITTSVAVDTIRGGVKVNALPEQVTTVVNHRVNIGSTTGDVQKTMTRLASVVAKKYSLRLVDFGESDDGTGSSITLSANNILEPAPLTSTSAESVAWRVLSGTTRALYGSDIIMSPGLMTGNTDTRFYWDLSKSIFRFNPSRGRGKDAGMGRIHTVDERMSAEGHLDAVMWFWGFIRNMDQL